jgi:hypothetical protein
MESKLLILACKAVVIWHGLSKYITVLDAHLKPISIPHIRDVITNSTLLPVSFFWPQLQICGMTEIFLYPHRIHITAKANVMAVSITLLVGERNAAHSGPPLPGSDAFTPLYAHSNIAQWW